jgi:PBP1b-binding outer membrane lipoprotein LpoB
MKKLIPSLAALALVLAGCSSGEPEVTKDEEKAYRNPPKEMPAGAREGMMKGMERARSGNQGG